MDGQRLGVALLIAQQRGKIVLGVEEVWGEAALRELRERGAGGADDLLGFCVASLDGQHRSQTQAAPGHGWPVARRQPARPGIPQRGLGAGKIAVHHQQPRPGIEHMGVRRLVSRRGQKNVGQVQPPPGGGRIGFGLQQRDLGQRGNGGAGDQPRVRQFGHCRRRRHGSQAGQQI